MRGGRHGGLDLISGVLINFEGAGGESRTKRRNADHNAVFLAFLPVLRSKTGKNQPGAALEHLTWRFFVLEPENSITFNGAVEFIFRGRREQKGEIPPCPRDLMRIKPNGAS